MGVELPKIPDNTPPLRPDYGFAYTSPAFDNAYIQFAKVKDLTRRMAEVDAAVARLSREWNGKAAEEAEAAIRGVRSRHVDNRFDTVERLADFLEERVAEGYRKTEEKRKTAAAEFR
jgi:V/A-type H+-transporting ATPase subunit D